MPFTRPELRALLDKLLRSDADFDAFAGDRFPDASRRFADGMDRVRKTNILLQQANLEHLTEALQRLERPVSPAGSRLATGRIKILFLASNPMSETQLDLAREARQMEERLGVGRPRDVLEIVPRWAARRSDLQRFLLEEKPHVLHFSGHASSAQLLFEDDHGNVAPLGKNALVDLIGILQHRLQLVVLNACDTEPLATALVRHVACAIGTRQSIGDDAAIAFATALYQALAFDEPVGTAFRLARNELKIRRVAEERTPVLKVKQDVDAETMVLTA
jgi:hypothetical protein